MGPDRARTAQLYDRYFGYISPFNWGSLIFFFEMATAYEGELLGVNAYDQPGVEGYKNYMYYKLRKPGISANVIAEIRKTPLKKSEKYII